MPSQIGRYRIVDRIGRGAMGVVYSAHDEMMGRPVALKVLMADLESDQDTRARFYREAQAAARLLHPNIITIFDAGEDQGRSYIAMQLLKGWPLSAYLSRPEAAPLERKLDLMVQICEGLAAAHGRDIVHRDLKPGNLFVQTDGLLKILDFGVARLADSSMTAAGVMLGTPDYMSPEQARGTQVDARSDVFSAGAVFYFMLTGRKPFPGPDLPAVLHQLQFEPPAAIPESSAPADLSAIVLHAMEKDAANRPPRINEVLASLVRFRRRYQAETRTLAASARTQYEIIESLSTTLDDAAVPLSLDQAPADSPVLRNLRERFPILTQRGGPGLDVIPFDRNRVTVMLQELESERQRLVTDLEQRRTHAALLDAGHRALAAGDPREALRQFEAVLAVFPASTRARTLADSCRAKASEQEARDRELEHLVSEARRAYDSRDWAAATRLCEQALELAPQQAAAATLLGDVEHAIVRERRRRTLMLQRFLDRAARALEQHHFDEAASAVREAEALDPQNAAVAELHRRLDDARAAAEAAELLRQLTADEIRRARSLFRRGQREQALLQLRTFLASEPQVDDVRGELERLASLHQHLEAAAAQRRHRVMEVTAAARSFWERGLVGEALERAREAAMIDPADGGAVALLDELLEADLQRRLAAERAHSAEQRSAIAEPMLAAARDALARGHLDLALNAAAAAARIAPEREDAPSLTAELRSLVASEDADLATDFGETIVYDPPVQSDRPEPGPVAQAADTGGVLAQVNHWAADLLRRWPAKS